MIAQRLGDDRRAIASSARLACDARGAYARPEGGPMRAARRKTGTGPYMRGGIGMPISSRVWRMRVMNSQVRTMRASFQRGSLSFMTGYLW